MNLVSAKQSAIKLDKEVSAMQYFRQQTWVPKLQNVPSSLSICKPQNTKMYWAMQIELQLLMLLSDVFNADKS